MGEWTLRSECSEAGQCHVAGGMTVPSQLPPSSWTGQLAGHGAWDGHKYPVLGHTSVNSGQVLWPCGPQASESITGFLSGRSGAGRELLGHASCQCSVGWGPGVLPSIGFLRRELWRGGSSALSGPSGASPSTALPSLLTPGL